MGQRVVEERVSFIVVFLLVQVQIQLQVLRQHWRGGAGLTLMVFLQRKASLRLLKTNRVELKVNQARRRRNPGDEEAMKRSSCSQVFLGFTADSFMFA